MRPDKLALQILVALVFAGCKADPPTPARVHEHAPPTSSASATPVASASGAPSAVPSDADAGPLSKKPKKMPPLPARPLVRTLAVPEETNSPMPKPDEWSDTPRRAVVDREKYDCVIQAVREWHRVTCSCRNASVALVAGTRTGVSVWATPASAQALFPVRQGDTRVFEVFPHPTTRMAEYGSWQEDSGRPVVLSETWLEGEDAPTIVVQ